MVGLEVLHPDRATRFAGFHLHAPTPTPTPTDSAASSVRMGASGLVAKGAPSVPAWITYIRFAIVGLSVIILALAAWSIAIFGEYGGLYAASSGGMVIFVVRLPPTPPPLIPSNAANPAQSASGPGSSTAAPSPSSSSSRTSSSASSSSSDTSSPSSSGCPPGPGPPRWRASGCPSLLPTGPPRIR